MLPVLRTVARDMGQMDYYDDVISEDQQITPPPGAPEMTVRARQVVFNCLSHRSFGSIPFLFIHSQSLE